MKNEKKTSVAEIRLTYQPALELVKQPKISTSSDAFILFRDSWDFELIEFVEQFKVMLLSRANNVIGILSISTGNVSGTIADPKLIMAAAIKANASGIILCHNHPSGSLKPSQADLDLTRKIREAGKFLDLPVLDHLIISRSTYFSIADEGLF
jgi:DNA repair protein RadC